MKSLRERIQGLLAQQKREEEDRKKSKPKYYKKGELPVAFSTREWKDEKKNAVVEKYRGGGLNSIIREWEISEIEKIYENVTYDFFTRLMIPECIWKISGSIWYKEDIRKKLLAWGITSQEDMLQEIFPYYMQEKQNYRGVETSKLYEEKEFYFARRLDNLLVKIGRILEGKIELREGESLESLKKKKEYYRRKISQYKGKKSIAKIPSLENLVYEDEQREKLLFWKGFTKLSQEKREKFYGKKGEKISVKEIPSEFLQEKWIEKYSGYCETEEEVESFSGILSEILKQDEEGIAGGIRYYLRNFSTMKKAKEEFRIYLNEKYELEESIRRDDRFSDREERIFFSSDWQRKDEWKRLEVIDEEEELVLV